MRSVQTPDEQQSGPDSISDVFGRRESEVRGYCRSFPIEFARGYGPYLYSAGGTRYIDFFSGAGGLNYGHNHPVMIDALIEYLQNNGVLHSLDLATSAKREFLEHFETAILEPRNLDYKIQFPGPTGTNAVEAALKLARKAKGRRGVIAFTNGYHGLTGNSLAVTGNQAYRDPSYLFRQDVVFMPYDGYHGPNVNTARLLARYLDDRGSGIDLPAAMILETVQAEGGIRMASDKWLCEIQQLCRQHDILLIIDDIQAGCGRTGTFFSFERAGIQPDMVTLSKSISGLGLPMSLLLIKPQWDCWLPGEHTGTFRGNNLAFVAGARALSFWNDTQFCEDLNQKTGMFDQMLADLTQDRSDLQTRGMGFIRGLEHQDRSWAGRMSRAAFRNGLIVETCGPRGEVLKLLPPLTISDETLREGMSILEACMDEKPRETVTAETH